MLEDDETARGALLAGTIVRLASLPAECDPAHRVGLDSYLFEVIARHTHSKVRISTPSGPDTIPVNIICPSHFAQGGRTIELRLGTSGMSMRGMMLPFA
jgi:hypothetical protein